MQVFVPFPDIEKSVACLDPTRLGNQIYRECLTLARGKWENHPVSKMWFNHTYFLCEYAFAGLRELEKRGRVYPDTFDKFHDIQMKVSNTGPPIWWGDAKVHISHQANLIAKAPEHYKQYFPSRKKQPYYYPNYSREEIMLHGFNFMKKNKEVV